MRFVPIACSTLLVVACDAASPGPSSVNDAGSVVVDTPAGPQDTTAPTPDGASTPDVPPTPDVPITAPDVPIAADVPVIAADVPPLPGSCRGPAEAAWTSDPNLCLVRFAQGVSRVRGLAVAPDGDLFVSAAGSVLVLFDADGDGVSGAGERATFGTAPGLNHGIAFSPDGAYLYASSDTAVYRWAYRPGLRAGGSAQAVVTGIPGGGHSTRSITFDAAGALYVSVGSAGNVDASAELAATRSLIRRFAVTTVPLTYARGENFATGLRNEVGLMFDRAGRMWGVENGRDDLREARFGGDIHEDNPAEEVNVLNGAGPTFFGYPQCWTEGATLTGGAGAGTQHVDTILPTALRRDEAFCQSAAMVRRPAFAMPAHWAPLGLAEYTGTVLPAAWRGSLFVTAHGSWNRSMAAGRLVARVQVDGDGRVTAIEPVVGQRNGAGQLQQGSWGVRPVDIQQGADGALYFTDDLGGRVFRIGYSR